MITMRIHIFLGWHFKTVVHCKRKFFEVDLIYYDDSWSFKFWCEVPAIVFVFHHARAGIDVLPIRKCYLIYNAYFRIANIFFCRLYKDFFIVCGNYHNLVVGIIPNQEYFSCIWIHGCRAIYCCRYIRNIICL